MQILLEVTLHFCLSRFPRILLRIFPEVTLLFCLCEFLRIFAVGFSEVTLQTLPLVFRGDFSEFFFADFARGNFADFTSAISAVFLVSFFQK